MNKTTNYEFNIPYKADNESADIDPISDNFVTIDTELAKKVDKVAPTRLQIYGVSHDNQTMLNVAGTAPEADGVPLYQWDENLLVAETPTRTDHATSKKYVDNAIASAITTTLNTEV